MEQITFENTAELKRTKEELEKALKVKITIKEKEVTIEGEAVDEYEASIVLGAIALGFSAKKALLLKNEEMIFRKLHIKDYTRRKNLSEIKARLIGTGGKTKKTIEELSNTEIVIKNNEVGIIGEAESIDFATTAIINIIRGSKQANVYHYLEEKNRINEEEDLGLKTSQNKK